MSKFATELKSIENQPREVEFNFDETNSADEFDQLITELNKNYSDGEFNYTDSSNVFYTSKAGDVIEVQIVPRSEFESLLDEMNMDTVIWNREEYVIVPQI